MAIVILMRVTNGTIIPPPSDPYERAAWVKFQLELRGLSLTAVANAEGVTRRAVSNALHLPSRFLEEAIALAIGLTPETLFPERYGANGQRLCRSREPHRTKRTEQDNKDHAAAA